MTISNEAVEDAAKALLANNRPSHADWDGWTDDGKDMWRDQARTILEAAAPIIRAESKAEALEWLADDFSVNLTNMSGPRIREWIKARAVAERGGE